jgi:uncharacterized protein YbjT (DUF2867 family)
MHIILGGTGRVGSAVAQQLLDDGEPVTIVSRNPQKAAALKKKGAEIAIVDVYDTAALHQLFRKGQRLFLLNPPALPSTDTVAEEKKTLYSIVEALKDSGIRKVVAESTYGAHPGDGKGDLNVLYEMEQLLQKMDVSVTVIRAAYYMSNWDGYLDSIKENGQLPAFFPKDFRLPMVAPHDIGQFAGQLMKEPIDNSALYYVEGPRQYTAIDVAAAFGAALKRSVEVVEIPEAGWIEAFKSAGFSQQAAESYAGMTKATIEDESEKPTNSIKGSTTIEEYINELSQRKSAAQ